MFKRIPLTLKMLLLTFIVGIVGWSILDYIQTARLKSIFHAQLVERLGKQAAGDRILFDRYVMDHHQAVKVLASQRRLIDYLEDIDGKNWFRKDNIQIKHYQQTPPWFPGFSVTRTHVQVNHYLLLDTEGRVREVYQTRPDPLPPSLLHPTSLIRELSHGQSYIISIDGLPYLIISTSVRDSKEELLATLMLASPLDEEFIIASQGSLRPGSIVALFTGDKPYILASNRPDLLPGGTMLDVLEDSYLITGKSFFDHGAFEIVMYFASFISKAEFDSLSKSILMTERRNRALTGVVLILSFLAIMFWITKYIQRLTNKVVDFSVEFLGAKRKGIEYGDQLYILEQQFQLLTEEVVAANELIKREAEERNRVIVNNSLDAIITIDDSDVIVTWNPGAETIFGYSRKEALGRKLFETIIPSQHREVIGKDMKEFLLETQEGNPIHSRLTELMAFRRDGHEFPVELSVSPVQTGEAPFFICNIRDITERKQAEEELRKHRDHLEDLVTERTADLAVAKEVAEAATSAKSDFLARMSHEIRTPMNAIIGLTNLTLKTELAASQRDHLIKVDESSRHLLRIINDILDFSKIEAGKLELESLDFMLNHVVDKMTNMFRVKAAESQIEMFYVIDKNVPLALKGDAFRVGQILINLISNAVKFTNRGSIIVRVMPNKDDVLPDSKQVSLLFSIEDSGVGIHKDKLDAMFQPFTQTDGSVTRKYGGTGLGLSICQRLVTLMGGRIWGESELGQGSTFYFTLTLDQGTEEKRHVLLSPPDIKGMKVLIVDDNETSRFILSEIMTGFDFIVKSAASGKEGLIELEHAASKKPYDLLIVDWKMPEMDGFEMAGRIRAHPKLGNEKISPKIIMITMYGRAEFKHEQKIKETSIDAYQMKPISSSELFNSIMEVFDREDAMVPRMVLEPEVEELEGINNIRGARLLLVEDNDINQDVAIAILGRADLIIKVVEDGKEAVDLLKAAADSEKMYFDAVLMDIEMPIMDGYAASMIIRKDSRFNDLPIIAMTAHALKGDRERCLEAGMNDYVSKPIDERELYTVLIKWIKHEKRDVPENYQTSKRFSEEPWVEMPSQVPYIDLKTGLHRIHGNTGLYKNMLRSFLDRFEKASEEFKIYLEKGNIKEAKLLTHSIKGVSGNIGAQDLARAAGDLDSDLKEEITEKVELLIEKFIQELFHVMESLRGMNFERETEEISSEETQEPEPAQIAPIFHDMRNLLEENNSRVRHSLPVLKEALKGPRFREKLEILDKSIYVLDFEKAISVISDIAKELSIPLREEKK